MDKVLIIAYYWPPSGGAGVQRWLKLTRYLQESGVQVYVICPRGDKASYLSVDQTVVKEIHPDIKVKATNSFEPVNIYKKLVGKDKVPTAGNSNVNPNNLIQNLILKLRSTLFVPDPRKFWGKYAYKAAKTLIKTEGISHVITTSPPHSVQLVGLRLKRELNIKWLADLRDLWTDIYYYESLNHSPSSRQKDANYEKTILENADHITTVSPGFIETFLQKSSKLSKDKFTFIPNGYDEADYSQFDLNKKTDFIFTYTGTINGLYSIQPFLEGMKLFIANHPESGIKIRFVGLTDESIREQIREHNLESYFEYIPYVPHAESIAYLESSFGLLVFGPLNKEKKEGSIPAKTFEYLRSGRPIIYMGQEDGYVAKFINDCDAGEIVGADAQLIADLLKKRYSEFTSSDFSFKLNPQVKNFARSEQANKFLHLLNSL